LHKNSRSAIGTSTWKPIAAFLLVCAFFVVITLFGVNHHTENLNSLGWALIGGFTVVALWTTRYW